MNWDETNADGVHLHGQTGREAVIAFDDLLGALPEPLRAAFEGERAARQDELAAIIAEIGYST